MRISDWSSDVCSSDLLGQRLQVRQVLVVPDAVLDEGPHLGGGMDLRLLGGDHGPAALRLHPAHGGGGGRVAVAHAAAVRPLVGAFAGGDRDRHSVVERKSVSVRIDIGDRLIINTTSTRYHRN